MSDGLWVVIGMSVMYLFSFAGLMLAWVHYRKHQKPEKRK